VLKAPLAALRVSLLQSTVSNVTEIQKDVRDWPRRHFNQNRSTRYRAASFVIND
jgi:hypothetical protein